MFLLRLNVIMFVHIEIWKVDFMKKLLLLTLLLLMSFSLIACDSNTDDPIIDDFDPTDIGYLDIYYMNDFHGSILEDSPDEIGLSNIGNFLISQKEAQPNNTIILAGGDMLQGSALSNYYQGLSTIELMNEMYFDAFTVGNHEFDWGIDVVTSYFDGNDANGEANFPLLGANIFLKNTTTIPENIDPYVIIERGDIKIGIIGTIGAGLEYSIATSKIEDYEFGSPIQIIKDITYDLRTNQDVDIVLVSSHDTGSTLNSQIAGGEGDYKVNAIFNGHSHSDYANTSLGIPVIQSGSNGEYVGHVRLEFTDNLLVNHSVENIGYYDNDLLRSSNNVVSEIIAKYQLETDELFNTPIITAGEYLSQNDLSIWIARMMRISTGADIGFQNGGGTRTSIKEDDLITLAVLYQVWPFDNVVKTVYLTGAQIKSQMNNLIYDTELSNFENDTVYKVATNDYTFDKTSNPFINGTDPFNTGIVLRDLAESELIKQSLVYDLFYVDNEIITVED